MPNRDMGLVWTKDESDAIAWRQLMRATEDLDTAVFNAWSDWKEREQQNGRAERSVGTEPA